MKNILLLVPTETYRAEAFITGAAALGVSLTIASERRQAMAASMGRRTLVVSMQNPEVGLKQIEQAADNMQFDAIISVDDGGLATAALASKKLGLKYISTNSAQMSNNKIAMRKRLEQTEISKPWFLVHKPTNKISITTGAIPSFPIIVKPASLSGSIGVMRIDAPEDVESALALCESIQMDHGCGGDTQTLIEQYISGVECAVEAMVFNDQLKILAIFDKPRPLEGPYFAETIYVAPSERDREIQNKLQSTLEEARKALEIKTGPIHAEFRITSDREVYLIELAARSIGGMCSNAIPLSGGRSLEELIIAEALGMEIPEFAIENQASGVFMMPVPAKGVLRSISGVEEAKSTRWITNVTLSMMINSEVSPIPYDARYVGFIFAKAPTSRAVVEALEEAFKKIEIEIS